MGRIAKNVRIKIMKEIVFATNNQHKIKEAEAALSSHIKILSLHSIGCHEELPETHETLEENAFEKANYVFEKYHVNCFAEDTGLEIEVLNGEPGVYSARYAGLSKNFKDNIIKVLYKMQDIKNRNACFRTIISLIIDGKEIQFEGKVDGFITEKITGDDGFGYDPIFQPKGFEQTFAQMDITTKNKISHRGKAVEKLIHYLINI